MSGKVVVVTGASSGIGRATAIAFGREGATVGLVARRAERISELAKEIEALGGKGIVLPADVAIEADIERAFQSLIEQAGRLDVLVNNAGTGIFGRKPTTEEFTHIFDVNVKAIYHLSNLAKPYLEESRGTIINIGSTAAQRPFAGEMVYMASKGAVSSMTKGMAAAWGKSGIRVNLVVPGVVESEFNVKAGVPEKVARQRHTQSESLNVLPTTGEPNDVAAAILFLASEQARFISGAELNVDGGISLGAIMR